MVLQKIPNSEQNQVSIAGELDGVETARARVRELTPLVICFDLPIMHSLQVMVCNTKLESDIGGNARILFVLQNAPPDPADQYLRAIQEQYVVQVTFRQKQKNFHTTMVVVKGCEWEAARVKEATLLLMEHLCGSGKMPPCCVFSLFLASLQELSRKILSHKIKQSLSKNM